MTLNPTFKSLCQRWREKANQYDVEDIDQLFDKFFSLYVAYNALYAEAYAYLRRKDIKDGKEKSKRTSDRFPDESAATTRVLEFLKSRSLIENLEQTNDTKQAIEKLKTLTDKQNGNYFWICLHPVSGEPQKSKDKTLIKELNSSETDKRARAILKLIYKVRCNMFHGRKSVEPIQKEILIPVIIILERIVDQLFTKLDSADYL
jgi:hypothetical protein